MDTERTNQPAILVDFNLLAHSSKLVCYLKKVQANAAIVLVVSDPIYNDYDENTMKGGQQDPSGIEFSTVIRNSKTKPMSDLDFKTAVLCMVQDMSNLMPVIAFDNSFLVRNMYRDGGVLYADSTPPRH